MKFTTFALAALFPLAVAAEGAPGSHFIENWDLNADGTVTLAELEEKRGDVFYMVDADENGMLNADEYAAFDELRAADMENQGDHAQGKMGRVQEGMTMTFNDTNDDGQVSKAEFLAKAADWLTIIDRDESGDVTSADFGPRG
jgi:uncharacterized membrane protein YkoI